MNNNALPPSPNENAQESDHDSAEEFVNKIFQLIDAGQTFKAYDIGKQALSLYPSHDSIKQGVALALLRTGAVDEAKRLITPVLERTYRYQPLDITTEYIHNSNVLALIYKESWRYSRLTDDLEVARNLYHQSFRLQPTMRTGVNAAALSWMIGEDETCQQLAHAVLSLHDKTLSSPDFHSHSDAAQAMLLLGDIDAALSLYNKAVKIAPKGYQAIVEIRESLFFLQAGGFTVPDQCFKILTAPVVVVFSGQMIDFPDQINPIFPYRLEPFVRAEIDRQLDELKPQIGYSAASCGAELIFIEAMLERDAEVNIILPFVTEDFLEERVRFAGPRWERRFTQALSQAHYLQYATHDQYLGHKSLYQFANQVMHGTAAIRAQFLSGKPHLMVAIPPQLMSDSNNITASFIKQWPDTDNLHLIDLKAIAQDAGVIEPTPPPPPPNPNLRVLTPRVEMPKEPHNVINLVAAKVQQTPKISEHERLIKCLLFSDLAGYSKLQDQHIPEFLKFMNELEAEMRSLPFPCESINTWGDAVFVVMENATQLAEYALRFRDIVERLGSKLYGVPAPIRARISLHGGPVYGANDPFLKRINYYGSHINRAARLEPVTVVGQVYATQQFVALLGAEQSVQRHLAEQQGLMFRPRFVTEYVGSISLAKNFGSEPVYHIRWHEH